MKYLQLSIFIAVFLSTINPVCLSQVNIDMLSTTDPSGTDNDIWGYVDTSGTEYAILGSQTNTYIYSLEDPSNPILREQIGGVSSSWRDIKSFGQYIYVIADAGTQGLLVIDMGEAPGNIEYEYWHPTLNINGNDYELDRCHNLYVDEDGYAYLSGCRSPFRDVIILDLFSTPGTPQYVGISNQGYSHDVYVRDSLMYTSNIYGGDVGIHDVSDRSNPVLLASQPTGGDFTHNAWLSDDGDVVYTTDEKSNAFVEAYDISDLNDIKSLDKFKPLSTVGSNLIPHNVHVMNDFLVISYYTYGVVIVDAQQPDNLIEVGHYDTYAGGGGGYSGCWGAFPFLPSGILLASDRSSGLYVLDPTYQRACYLRGTVRDSQSLAPIVNATIQILTPELNDGHTNNFGEYATGILDSGTYDVVVSHPYYESDTIQVSLDNGMTTQMDAYLVQPTPPCEGTMNLSGDIKSNEYYAAFIIADGVISSGSEVGMYASDETTLAPGFEIELGAVLLSTDDVCE